ncbi:hypothetical protein [Cellulosimicrobium protaetiae]|uniref:DUF4352 domain-containing protein n=1 Tax=Cellulosimicrobium protaetiae TaxID=2587808 RepID=A0A6M5UCP4_9MICO|nr:hypothetical protein [Cellulosimicrobium protaetiae]QJW36307.1 hypothetical protein FIC82_008970 [Cellulosimicrobium protaetiae]
MDDPTTSPGPASSEPAWGTAPGTETGGAKGGRVPPDPEEPGAPPGPDEHDPVQAATTAQRRGRWSWRTAALVAATAGVLLVVAVLATEAVTARRGWAHVGGLYAVAGAAVVAVGAVVWRRGTRGVAGATRALVALLAGTVVLTAWVTVDVVTAGGPGYGPSSSLRGYPLGGGYDEGPEIGAASDRVWYGDSVRYADGLVVAVSAPQPYTPTEHTTAREDDFPDSVRVRVRVTNGTDRAVDPGGLDLQPVSGGLVARKVFDYAPDVLLDRPDTIAPGTSAEWDVVYNVYDPEDVAVGLEPTWANYAVAVFSW